MTTTQKFCRIARERSIELSSTVQILLEKELYGQVVAALRQQLDTLVRVVYLLNINDLAQRQHFIEQTINNEKWTLPNSRTQVKDFQMVELANTLHGWTKSVYKLGCAFIHLSPLIDYKNENPFSQLSLTERNDIKNHLHNYHSFPLTNDLTMQTIKPYLPKVFKKVSDNLAVYIDNLERNEIGVL